MVVRQEMREKWSDGDVGRAVMVGERGESTAVMSRSSVLPSLWVETLTCCVMLKSDRMDVNCTT